MANFTFVDIVANKSPTLSISCFGPVKVDIVTENCTELIRYQKLPRTHHFATFHEELLRLSAHFHVSRIFHVYYGNTGCGVFKRGVQN